LQNLVDRTCFPSIEEYEKAKQGYSVLDDNSPEMRALKGHHKEHRDARTIAYSAEFPVLAGDDDYCVDSFFLREDEANRIRISQHRTRHFLYGASMDHHYEICGAGAPFERLFFEAREQLNQATDELARERCDRAYVEELRAEWEDIDCIEGFLDSQAKLRKAREDLDSAHDQIRYLIDEVQRLKQSSV
jgi:hypothetical protein